MEDKLQAFKRSALFSALITYFLIFVGGLVRVSGAGLGCPDWPKCFGRWIPPLHVSQLPADIDPHLFNFTLAWIEYINRIIGMVVGLAILTTAILAIIHFRKQKAILLPSLIAAVLVAFQGWQGGQVVSSELEPLLVSSHLIIAIIIASLLLYVLHRVSVIDGAVVRNLTPPGVLKIGAAALWVLLFIQIILGTQVRGAVESNMSLYPLISYAESLEMVGFVDKIHRTTGLITILLSLAVAVTIWKREKGTQLGLNGRLLAIVAGGQLAAGMLVAYLGVPPIAQLVHLWFAGLMAGILLLLNSSLNIRLEVRDAK